MFHVLAIHRQVTFLPPTPSRFLRFIKVNQFSVTFGGARIKQEYVYEPLLKLVATVTREASSSAPKAGFLLRVFLRRREKSVGEQPCRLGPRCRGLCHVCNGGRHPSEPVSRLSHLPSGAQPVQWSGHHISFRCKWFRRTSKGNTASATGQRSHSIILEDVGSVRGIAVIGHGKETERSRESEGANQATFVGPFERGGGRWTTGRSRVDYDGQSSDGVRLRFE